MSNSKFFEETVVVKLKPAHLVGVIEVVPYNNDKCIMLRKKRREDGQAFQEEGLAFLNVRDLGDLISDLVVLHKFMKNQ